MIMDFFMSIPPSKTLLAAVDAFLDSHYEFRCKDIYKGFLGKIRGWSDRFEAEQHEQRTTGEKRYVHRTGVYYSDPFGAEVFGAKDTLSETLENPFSIALMELIESKGKDSVGVYKRANIDRKLFSKIRSQSDYIPSKKTIIALALALELSFDETQALLERAGFTLSRSIMFDVIIEYFISQGKYDIHEINAVLFAYKQPPLG